MYVPEAFAERRSDVLCELIRNHPLATLVVLTSDGIVANHLPMLHCPPALHSPPAGTSGRQPADGFGTLHGHVARANPVWRDANGQIEALAIFQGPQGYVSPGWYPGKHAAGGKVVPTWNYVVVQARGTLRFIQDPAWLLEHVTAQTDVREARSGAARWRVSDAPAAFIDTLLHSIVGCELAVRTLTGKWKLSQNKSVDDRAGVVAGRAAAAATAAQGDPLAQFMSAYRSP